MFNLVPMVKGAWLENFEKLILLKLVDKVSLHLNIFPSMKKKPCKIVSRDRRKLCLCHLLFYLLWWPRFLISKQHFRWFLLKNWNIHSIFHHKSQKNMTKLLIPNSQWVWIFFFFLGGDDVVDMSGTLNLESLLNIVSNKLPTCPAFGFCDVIMACALTKN